MNPKKKNSDNDAVVTLHGDLTIAHAAELKKLLHESLDRSQRITVRLEDVTAVDLSCLQLLCSAHRTASTLDKRLTLKGSRPAIFQQTMQQAGFIRQKGCTLNHDTACLWCGGDQ